MADAPSGVRAPAQYGPGVRGLATFLLAGQYLPLARTAELFTELLGSPVSQGSLATWYAAGCFVNFWSAISALRIRPLRHGFLPFGQCAYFMRACLTR